MSVGLQLEQYIDSLENLPNELQRNFGNMRELDHQTQDVMKSIDEVSDAYMKNVKNYSPDKRSEAMSNIQKMYNRAKECSDDKVQLAIQTYELVDKHIRRLDSDLAKFEAEIKEKAIIISPKKDEEISKTKKLKKMQFSERKKKVAEKGGSSKGKKDEEEEIKKRNKKKKDTDASSIIASVLPGLTIAHPSDVLDMPVDPNEPTYCLCHQVSYGEMIACDKTDCPIEWFHFACVGLTTKPKGRWYCPKCINERKKK